MMMMLDDDDEASMSLIEDTSEESDSNDSDPAPYNHSLLYMLHRLADSGQVLLSLNDRRTPNEYSPPANKYKPDTSVLDKSEFSLITKRNCGLLENEVFPQTNNVTSLLRNRETGLYRDSRFSKATKCKVASHYIPNDVGNTIAISTAKVFCGIFSADGNTFLTASQDRNIKLYNVNGPRYKAYKTVRAREMGWSIIDVAFSPDGNNFVYSTWAPILHMGSVHGYSDHQEPLNVLNVSRRFCVFSVVYSSDGKELVCGANDGCLYIYNLEVQKRTLKVPAHDLDINRVLFADKSSHIIYSGGDDGLVKVWDRRMLDDRICKPVGLLAGHMDGITYIDSSADGRHLISNSKDQSIKLWDVRVFSPEKAARESLLVVRMQPWDYRWQGVPTLKYKDQKLEGDRSIMTYRGHMVAKTLIRARFSPMETTGQRYIYTGCAKGAVIVYDSLTGEVVRKLRMHSACVRDVSWHPTRNEILSSAWDGLVMRWVNRDEPKEKVPSTSTTAAITRPLRRSARLARYRHHQQRN